VDVDDFHFACRTIGDFLLQVFVLDVEFGRELDFAVGRHGGRPRVMVLICTARTKVVAQGGSSFVVQACWPGSIQMGYSKEGLMSFRQLVTGYLLWKPGTLWVMRGGVGRDLMLTVVCDAICRAF
jgi:hypothetical protein